MTPQLITAAITINNQIKPAERQLKDAALGAAELLRHMLDQHERSGVADAVGLSAIGYAARAAMLAVEAREATIRAHGALNIDLKRVGLSEMMGKDGPLSPNGPAVEEVFTTGSAEDDLKLAA